jgi:DNA-binding NtrC family response regulator
MPPSGESLGESGTRRDAALGRGAGNSPAGSKNSVAVSVLVVDDELLIRWSLAEALSEAGYDVTEAADAAAAMNAIRTAAHAPDVVLLDFRLPDSSDLGLLEAIKRISPRSEVILMTAYGTSDVIGSALARGAFEVVGKPFAVHDMTALVARAHGARRG